jgi:hypothetical protein
MTTRHPAGGDALIAPLYFLAALLLVTPVIDFFTSILPFRFSELQWRFASVGLLSGFLLTPLLGTALLMGVAHYARHMRTQRLFAIVNLAITVLFVLLLLAFLLDVLQLRNAVQPEAQSAFAAAASKAALKHLTFIVALGWLSWTGFRMSRWPSPSAERASTAILLG